MAELMGANTVKDPVSESVVARSLFTTAVTRSVWSAELTATSTTVHVGSAALSAGGVSKPSMECTTPLSAPRSAAFTLAVPTSTSPAAFLLIFSFLPFTVVTTWHAFRSAAIILLGTTW